jgi:hypothetical protein
MNHASVGSPRLPEENEVPTSSPGAAVRITRDGGRCFFETSVREVTFDFDGRLSNGETIQAPYSICKTGAAPVLFFVEEPGGVTLTEARIGNERLKWPSETPKTDLGVRVERRSSEDHAYCRWVYTVKNPTDDSVSGQVDFFHNEDVSSWVSFNLPPRGERRAELDINFIISVDENARIIGETFVRNPVFRFAAA